MKIGLLLTLLEFGCSWNSPVVISNSPGTATEPVVAVNGLGNALGAWTQQEGAATRIWANAYSGGSPGSWGTAIPLELAAGDSRTPAVALNDLGQGAAVWVRSVAGQPEVWASVRLGGSWKPAVQISAGDWDKADPKVALDAAGRAIAVWKTVAPFPTEMVEHVFAARYQGKAWGNPVDLSLVNGGYQDPAGLPYVSAPVLAMNGSGKALVAWNEYFDASGSTVTIPFDPQGGWGAATPFATGYTYPIRIGTPTTIAMNARGDVALGGIFIHTGADTGWVMSRIGGVWQGPEFPSDGFPADPANGYSGYPGDIKGVAVGIDAGSYLAAAFLWDGAMGTLNGVPVTFPPAIYFATRAPGGAWTTLLPIDTSPNVYLHAFAMVTDPSLVSMILWEEFPFGTPNAGALRAQQYIPSGRYPASYVTPGLGAAATLTPPDALLPNIQPLSLGTNNYGACVAVWPETVNDVSQAHASAFTLNLSRLGNHGVTVAPGSLSAQAIDRFMTSAGAGIASK